MNFSNHNWVIQFVIDVCFYNAILKKIFLGYYLKSSFVVLKNVSNIGFYVLL